MASSKLLLAILVSHILSLVGSHAALPSQLYWESKLPNTPMPQSIKDSLQSDNNKNNSWTESEDVGETNDIETTKGLGKAYATRPTRGNGVTVSHKGGGRPVYVGVSPGGTPFNYLYAAELPQLRGAANQAVVFFLQKDLHNGTTMTLHFPKHPHDPPFLPKRLAERIPFSSAYLPQILAYFRVKPGSIQAQIIKNTVEECEEEGIKGEEKCCSTTVESMVDFVVKKLGRDVQVAATRVAETEAAVRRYTIGAAVRMLRGRSNVVCHKKSFPCALFYCHTTKSTRTYKVPLESAEGTKVNAVAVCHTDTSGWNPKHLAFRMLKVNPGTLPICHFLPESHIVWVLK